MSRLPKRWCRTPSSRCAGAGSGWGCAEKALAYLRQAVVNRSRSVLRHRTVAGDNPQQALPDTSDAEHGTQGLLEQAVARAALRGLPDRQREAIVLRYDAGLSEDEIAAAMGISRGAVKSHTARGLSALRAALDQASSHPARPRDSDDPGSPISNAEFPGLAARPGKAAGAEPDPQSHLARRQVPVIPHA